MQFDHDELALLSRSGNVPRSSRAGPAPRWRRERRSGVRRIAELVLRLVLTVEATLTGVRATWAVFGDEDQSRGR
jgi:hypothetical protein